jgi:hypothetical protein
MLIVSGRLHINPGDRGEDLKLSLEAMTLHTPRARLRGSVETE